MERLLHYIWKYRLYSEAQLFTVEGLPVSIIDPGIANTDSGPDFFNAKVRIGDAVWAGNIEIHQRSSDWRMHRHDVNQAYDSVILHVVGEYDEPVYRTNGDAIPHLVLSASPAIKQNIDWLLSRDTTLPCDERLCEIQPLHISAWLNALLTERLERKTKDILNLLAQNGNDWNEAMYITLMRSFGFHVNSDAFEWLAKSLPFKYILKQRCNSLQIEALLLGQAGLLNDDNPDDYYLALQNEYRFLQKKYNLQPIDTHLIKSMRTRPFNFPHIRLAQLAAIWTNNDTLFSKILECNDLLVIRNFFNVAPSPFWETHYNFKRTSPRGKKKIGLATANNIIINTVVPILFAYGQTKNLPDFKSRAIEFLESIPPESNNIIRAFADAGVKVNNSADSQALIQLKREYCEQKKCLYCRIGFRIIKRFS